MFEQSSRPLKVALSVLFVTTLAVVVLIILAQRGLIGNKTTSVAPVTTNQPQTATKIPPAVVQQQAEGLSTVAPLPTGTISIEDAQKQLQAIQEQVNAGTLTKEEAQKQMNIIGSQMVPPPMPPEIQKQIDDAKKAQQ